MRDSGGLSGSRPSVSQHSATDGPRRVVSEFIKNVETGDFDRLMMLLSRSIVNAVGIDALGRIFNRDTDEVWQRGGVDRIDVLGESSEEAAVVLRVRIRYGDGTSDKGSISLIREEGSWKIDMMS